MFPAHLLLPLMLRRAPLAAPTPWPRSVRASPVTVMPPCSCSAAPLATVVPPAVVPRALLCWMFNTPALIAVFPA